MPRRIFIDDPEIQPEVIPLPDPVSLEEQRKREAEAELRRSLANMNTRITPGPVIDPFAGREPTDEETQIRQIQEALNDLRNIQMSGVRPLTEEELVFIQEANRVEQSATREPPPGGTPIRGAMNFPTLDPVARPADPEARPRSPGIRIRGSQLAPQTIGIEQLDWSQIWMAVNNATRRGQVMPMNSLHRLENQDGTRIVTPIRPGEFMLDSDCVFVNGLRMARWYDYALFAQSDNTIEAVARIHIQFYRRLSEEDIVIMDYNLAPGGR